MRVVTVESLARRLNQCARRDLLVALGLDDFLAAIKPGRADVMTAMNLSRGRFDRRGRVRQKVVRAMHPTLRRRLLVLLDSHGQPREKAAIVPEHPYVQTH